MFKKIIAILFIVAFLATAGVVLASPGNKYGKALTPPFPQPAEKELQKVVFIRYVPGFEKEKSCDHDGVCDAGEKGWCADCKEGKEEPSPTPEPTACYSFLAGSKPKWNWVEDYYYATADLKTSSVRATGVWEEASASGDIFGEDLPGGGNWGVYDYTNSILYGNYPKDGVLAVTAIWFRGKNIYEYDIMLDDDYFPEGPYDLNTVVLHEFGHAAGLGDLYNSVCQDEVMYGYLSAGEEKHFLRPGDIIGIQTLYGN